MSSAKVQLSPQASSPASNKTDYYSSHAALKSLKNAMQRERVLRGGHTIRQRAAQPKNHSVSDCTSEGNSMPSNSPTTR
jgi:hypothetical protein